MFKMPPEMYTSKSELRKVGFEIEFSDMKLYKAAEIIKELFGGKINRVNDFYLKVEDTSFGDFEVLIDATYLSKEKYKNLFDDINLKELFEKEEFNKHYGKILNKIFKTVVPFEIVAPPIALDDLEILDMLRKKLFNEKATGTTNSAHYAFGVHINPEMPDLNTESILRYVKAFVILYPWLNRILDIDPVRRVTPFIKPFPAKFNKLILDKSYKPSIDKFISDYNKYNPDRNRPLDLYPLFAYINKEKVESFKKLGKVSARPTLHYRLPNSLIDKKNWSLAVEWNYWVEVEKMASDEKAVDKLSKKYLETKADNIFGFEQKWIKEVNKWLQDTN